MVLLILINFFVDDAWLPELFLFLLPSDQQQFLQTISNIFSNFTSTHITRRCVEISLNNLYVDIGAKGLRYIKFLES